MNGHANDFLRRSGLCFTCFHFELGTPPDFYNDSLASHERPAAVPISGKQARLGTPHSRLSSQKNAPTGGAVRRLRRPLPRLRRAWTEQKILAERPEPPLVRITVIDGEPTGGSGGLLPNGLARPQHRPPGAFLCRPRRLQSNPRPEAVALPAGTLRERSRTVQRQRRFQPEPGQTPPGNTPDKDAGERHGSIAPSPREVAIHRAGFSGGPVVRPQGRRRVYGPALSRSVRNKRPSLCGRHSIRRFRCCAGRSEPKRGAVSRQLRRSSGR